MVFKGLKRTLESIVSAACLATFLTVTPAKAETPKNYSSPQAPSHINWIENNQNEARIIVFGANVVFGCLKSGIGSYINEKGFWSGCGKGVLGGAIAFIGEGIAISNNYPMMGAAGKIIYNLGLSIEDNVMRGEGMFDQYEIDVGPINFTFRNGAVPDFSFTLTPVYGILEGLVKGYKFDAKSSLYNLTPVFKIPSKIKVMYGDLKSSALGNVIHYIPNEPDYERRKAHEFNHTLASWSGVRFCRDLFYWVMPEEIQLSEKHVILGVKGPKIPKMEDIERRWNIGQDLMYNLLLLPQYLDVRAYFYNPFELRARSMEIE